MNNELTRNMYRLQSFANPLVFNSLAKKSLYFTLSFTIFYIILATDWIHLLGRKVLKLYIY